MCAGMLLKPRRAFKRKIKTNLTSLITLLANLLEDNYKWMRYVDR